MIGETDALDISRDMLVVVEKTATHPNDLHCRDYEIASKNVVRSLSSIDNGLTDALTFVCSKNWVSSFHFAPQVAPCFLFDDDYV